MMAPILAFNDPWHDSSFVLFDRGAAFHVESERFTRRKYEYLNPIIIFSELFPDKVESFFTVVVQTNGELAEYMARLVNLKRSGCRDPEVLLPVPLADRYLPHREEPKRGDTPALRSLVRHLLRPDVSIFFCGHHAAHAANAFFSSALQESLIVTLDGGGKDFLLPGNSRNLLSEEEYSLFGHASLTRNYGGVYRGSGNSCELQYQLREYSIGEMWNRVVPLLGLKNGEEGTAMAMAALGDPERFLSLLDDPTASYPEEWLLSKVELATVERWLDQVRNVLRGDRDVYDISAALQASTEKRVRAFLKCHVLPEHSSICLAGGVFLNCQITGKLQQWFPQLNDVYIPPAPYDGGLAIGAAQLVHHELRGNTNRLAGGAAISGFAMGASYSRAEVLASAEELEIQCCEADDVEVLRQVSAGKTVALFQGGAESGRRALGNRSIVAHPGFPGLKDKLNNLVKHRQWFRPFAPMVLAEHVSQWFDCEARFTSPYMSFAIPVRKAAAERLENILHLDGTARVQTVHKDLTPRLHHLLTLWHDMTGIPVLLNTSFNDNEPIVESPKDAMQTFLRTPIDGLYFADHGFFVGK